MKIKNIFTLGLCLSALFSCNRVDLIEQEQNLKENKEGVYITLMGDIMNEETKVSIGESDGQKYTLKWTKDDALGIFSAEQAKSEFTGNDTTLTVIENVAARLDPSSDGQTSGKFYVADPLEIEEGVETDLLIYYPYKNRRMLVANSTSMDVNIPCKQTVSESGDISGLISNSFAYAHTSVKSADEYAKFSLTWTNALVKVVVKSQEFENNKLKAVILRDLTGTVNLAGSYVVNLQTDEYNYSEDGTKTYLKATIEKPQTLGNQQVIWLSSLPADFSNKELYVAFEMEDANGNTVTIPVAKKNGLLKKNAVNTLEVLDLKKSDNTLRWYEPEDLRELAGGWAYGSCNTFVVSTNSSKWVDGEGTALATGTPISDPIVVDVKARGDFAFVEEPKYAKIIWGSHNDFSANSESIDCNGVRNFTSIANISDDYTMTLTPIKTANAGYQWGCSKIAIMKEDKTTMLWAFSVWTTQDELKTFSLKCGASILDRNIGSRAASWDDWKNGGAYFQWGRPFPFGWSQKNLGASQKVTQINTSEYDLLVSIQHPDLLYASASKDTLITRSDWHVGELTGELTDRNNNLWGNENASPMGGKKTIYDPCPKGYKVISPAVIKEISENAVVNEASISKKARVLEYVIDENNTVNFPYAGGWIAFVYNGNNNVVRTCAGSNSNNTHAYAIYWSNAPIVGSHTAKNLYKIGLAEDGVTESGFYDKETVKEKCGSRSCAWPVRCMVDNDNL